MVIFLTSSPCKNIEGIDIPCILNEDNEFLIQLRKYYHQGSDFVIMSADPDAYAHNDEMLDTFVKAFQYHGMEFEHSYIVDHRICFDVSILQHASIVLLAGGHVPTQNAYFHEIHLKEAFSNYDGCVIGISAGSMNAARIVYAQPECIGESLDPKFPLFMPGLSLCDQQILPHYQMLKGSYLDGRRLYEDIVYGHSYGHIFYVLIDGSYLMIEKDTCCIFGEAYTISNGKMQQICKYQQKKII